MFCGKCGAQLEDGARFCPECGARIEVPGQGMPQGAPMPGATMAGAPVPAPGMAPRMAYNKGCLAQAFQDMTKTPGVFMRILQISFLPALIFLVSTIVFIIPIIGAVLGGVGYIVGLASMYCCSGYAIEWGRELSRGRGFNVGLPMMRTSTLSLGFFSGSLIGVLQLLAALLFLCLWISFTILFGSSLFAFGFGYVRVEGLAVLLLVVGLVWLALFILVDMFAYAAVMHMAVTGRVESTFSLGKVFKVFKAHLGKLFCAVELPNIIVFTGLGLILLILGLVLGGISGAILYNSYSSYSYYGYSGNPFAGLFASAIPLIIFVVIAAFLGFIVFAFLNMLKFRALGHWAARYAPEWVSEGDEDFVLLGRKNPNVSVNVNYQPPVR